MPLLVNVEVLQQEEKFSGYYQLELFSPEIVALNPRPGQFVHLKCSNSFDPLLRRPFSIHALNRKKKVLTLLYRVAGRGTSFLAEKKSGEMLSLMGPLGHGFSLPEERGVVAVIAGGIGIAPLFFLLQELAIRKQPVDVFLGARSSNQLLAVEAINKLGYHPEIATDDGSEGYKGTVTGLFAEKIDCHQVIFVYGCGPQAMLKELCLILKEKNIPGEVSLEEQMGCGVGACLSCVCKIKTKGENGFKYQRVCKDGPVFPVREVLIQ